MSFIDYFQRVVERDDLRPDPAQDHLVKQLDDMAKQLITRRRRPWFFTTPKPVKGIYVYGPVGRGKSLITNYFIDYLRDTTNFSIYRRHRHDFFTELHGELAKHPGHRRAAIKKWGKTLAKQYDLIAIDEMEVTDVADAMLLPPLFDALLDARKKTCVIMTSNIAPDDLYAGGLQRDRFVPFINWIHGVMRVVNLDHGLDYRLSKLPADDRYFYPLNDTTQKRFNDAVNRLIGSDARPLIVDLGGRAVTIDRYKNGSGVSDFDDLCDNPYGTADYDRLADRLRLLFLDQIPILSADEKDRTKRFIHLVDVFYDRGRRIIPRAEALPGDLLSGGPLMGEFQRTASRLEAWRREEL